jgi:cellulose synthase/poly-beta-1,6-N-acetylglucosamine synthase-like glycosyltransferase
MNLTNYLLNWQEIIFILLCSITAIQIFYYLFFFSRLAFFKNTTKDITQTHPVSVIICARDEAANLAKNLPGSLVQAYSTTHEVIVVNDNSFDDSKYLLEEFERDFKHLKVVELKQEAKMIPGKKFPLSIGIKTAKYEIVLLTDADCVPSSELWIEKIQESYDDSTEIVLGYGAYHKKKGLLNRLIRWETFHTALQYLSYALAGKPYMGVGRNLSYKKVIFFRHKGFSSFNHISSGDDDLFINISATKNNTKINISPEAFTLSDSPSNWNQWIKQKRRHYSTAKYYKPLHKFLLGLYSLTHFLFFPILITAIAFYNWQWSLLVFFIRFIIQIIILYPSMKKLNEKDLFPFFLLLDLWMFFYYFIFSITLILKPRTSWK